MEREGDAEGLIKALDTTRIQRSANLRTAVVHALRRTQSPQAVSVASGLLASDSSEAVRRAAASALGEFGDSRALPALRSTLEDESRSVRLWTIRSIGRLRDRESVERLIGFLDDPDWGFRSYAAGALGDIGDQRATEPLIAHLDDRKGAVQIAVSSALGRLGDSRAVPALRELRRRTSWWRRRRLGVVLRELEDQFDG